MNSDRSDTDLEPGCGTAGLSLQITQMRQRLANAESDRDAWRAAGVREKHLESCSLVDALELQLERLSEGLRQERARESKGEREARAEVTYDGRQYRWGSYRYDRLEDALAYAQIARARGEAPDSSAASAAAEPRPGPAETALMGALGVTLDERGGFRFGAYRYDRLTDALAYAKHHHAKDASVGRV